MSESSKAHIIIPTTANDADMVAECLVGVFSYTHATVCLVVNTDSQRAQKDARSLWEILQTHNSGAVAIFLPRCVGYVAACNIGWECIAPRPDDYVGVLNDDVSVDGDFISPMVKELQLGSGQVGPSIHHIGADGYWGHGHERYQFLEGWCWLAKASTIFATKSCVESDYRLPYDVNYSPGYCEDCDLSIRIQRLGLTLRQVDLPLRHLRSRTFGANREPFWSRNRAYLAHKWDLGG